MAQRRSSWRNGFIEIAVGRRDLGALERFVVGVGGQKYDGRTALLSYARGGRDAVHRPAQANVHEHQIRPRGPRRLDGALAGIDRTLHAIAQTSQGRREVERNDALVLDDEDARGLPRAGRSVITSRQIRRSHFSLRSSSSPRP